MKIRNEEIQVDTSGLRKQGAFGIEMNTTLMTMLYKNIYSNPILAVVRELGCNARDAQIVNGNKDVNIEVHLPNSFEPWFEIRDFGCGMSKEVIEKLYAFFGRSDKREDDGLIGGMGFGSKAPLAYADTFTVTSFLNGKKYVYLIFKDEQGHPNWGDVAEEDTSEPNGVCINVPVKDIKDDFKAFQEAFKRTFQYFDVPVTTTGVESVLNKVTYSVLTPLYGIRDLQCDLQDSNIVMGNTMYPIKWENLRLSSEEISKFSDLLLSKSWGGVVSCGYNYDYFFNIGELDITPSREDIQYSERTVEVLKKRLHSVCDTIIDNFQKVIDTKENLCEVWDALSIGGIKQKVWKSCRFKGNPIKDILFFNKDFELGEYIPDQNDPFRKRNRVYVGDICISDIFDTKVKRNLKVSPKVCLDRSDKPLLFVYMDTFRAPIDTLVKFYNDSLSEDKKINKAIGDVILIKVNDPSLKQDHNVTSEWIKSKLKEHLFGESEFFVFKKASDIISECSVTLTKKVKGVVPARNYEIARNFDQKFIGKTEDEIFKSIVGSYLGRIDKETEKVSPSDTPGKFYIEAPSKYKQGYMCGSNFDIERPNSQYLLYKLGIKEVVLLKKSEVTKGVILNWVNLETYLQENVNLVKDVLKNCSGNHTDSDLIQAINYLQGSMNCVIGVLNSVKVRKDFEGLLTGSLYESFDTWYTQIRKKLVGQIKERENFIIWLSEITTYLLDNKYFGDVSQKSHVIEEIQNKQKEQNQLTKEKALDIISKEIPLSDELKVFILKDSIRFIYGIYEVITCCALSTSDRILCAKKLIDLK